MENMKKQSNFIAEYKERIARYYDVIDLPKKFKTKLKGAVCAGLMREYIMQSIQEQHINAKVSANNVYISGYPQECDLLILKEDAVPVCDMPAIYLPEDVIAVIECKSSGIWPDFTKNIFEGILRSIDSMKTDGHPVKFGYLTLAEAMPRDNKEKYIGYADRCINEYISDENQKSTRVFCFAKLDTRGEYPVYNGNRLDFDSFIANLCAEAGDKPL